MAQEYYNLEKSAEVLGVSPGEVNQMRERHELHAYRDGANWKFKKEDVEDRLAEMIKQRHAAKAGPSDEDQGDVLLSEVELGESDPGASGTVIGPAAGLGSPGDSDIQLADSDIKLGGSDLDLTGGSDASVDMDAKVDGFEELDLTLDEDLTIEDSQISLSDDTADDKGGSDIDLSDAGALDDDDMVLGGSGSGSDITIGGDSGISLMDPADSGLSLEAPLDLGTGDESLELGEDDMLTFSEEADTESPTELKTDDDFLLTPLDEGGDEDSESGSQVIALDTDGIGEEADALGAAGAGPMAAMLDEDLSAVDEGLGIGGMPVDAGAAPAAGAPQGFAEGAPVGAGAATLPEAPYSVWNIVSLSFCAIFLVLTGMMCVDLLRNMWSWDQAYNVNSSLMDAILGMFEG